MGRKGVKEKGKGRKKTNWGRERRGRETRPPIEISGYTTDSSFENI